MMAIGQEVYDTNDVFISYRRVDGSLYARLLSIYLSEMGYTVFFDRKNVIGGQEISEEIKKNLQHCKDFILIITPELFGEQIKVAGDWVAYEIETILKRGNEVHILPIIIPNLSTPKKGALPKKIQEIMKYQINRSILNFYDSDSEIISRLKEELRNCKFRSEPILNLMSEGEKGESRYNPGTPEELKRLKIQAENLLYTDMLIINDITKVSKKNNQKLTVLDIGCAGGIAGFDRFSGDCFKYVLGIDKNKECIKEAKKKYKALVGKFGYLEANLEAVNFDAVLEKHMKNLNIESFDLIFAAQVLHHIKEPEVILQKLRKFLSSKGYIIIRGSDDGSKLAYGDEGLVKKIIDESKKCPGMADRESGRKIYYWLENAGFQNIRISSFMRETSRLNPDQKDKLFQESFSYRSSREHLPDCEGNETSVVEADEIYEKISSLLNKLNRKWFSPSLWYCEYDYIGYGQNIK